MMMISLLRFWIDLCWSGIFGGALLLLTRSDPMPHWIWIPSGIALFLAVRALRHSLFKDRVKRTTPFSLLMAAAGASLIFLGMTYESFSSHPIFFTAPIHEEAAAIPSAQERDFSFLPFYYSLGAWPTSFNGKPVFYSLPYEKGPPFRFMGRLTARWDPPETQLTFLGPKTPALPEPIEKIRHCLSSHYLSEPISECWALRSRMLQPHFQELRSRQLKVQSLEWLRLTPSGAEALCIEAANSQRQQRRCIWITSQGAHQTILLDSKAGAAGEAARAAFAKSLRSLRFSEQLDSSKLWIAEQLRSIRLSDWQKLSTWQQRSEALSKIQAFLIAKASLDPKSYEAFYHLAGTAFLLSKDLIKNASPDQSLESNEILASAKSIVIGAGRIAQDIHPEDPLNSELMEAILEVGKY